jgi:hypothetical protein
MADGSNRESDYVTSAIYRRDLKFQLNIDSLDLDDVI